MAIQQSSTATNAILTRYEKKYREGADYVRTYDQFAGNLQETFEPKGTTVQVFGRNKLQPRPTADVGSETSDFEPQTWTDVTNTVTANYYADGVKVHQKAQITNFDDNFANTAYLVGQNMMETQDALARRSACQGNIVFYGGGNTARTGLTLSTATHRLRDVDIQKVKQFVAFWSINRFADDSTMAVISDWQYADLLTQSGSQVLQAGAYTEKGLSDFVLRWELGQLAGIRLVVSPYAKICYGAGAAHQTAISGVTLGAAATAGARTVNLSGTITNLAGGDWLTIGTVQTANESDATILTEAVYVTDTTTATQVAIVGRGPLGGLLYAHDSGAACTKSTGAHLAVFGGPKSLVKIFASELGEYGEMVAPFETGQAKQWTNFSWKGYWGFGIVNQADIIRVETASANL